MIVLMSMKILNLLGFLLTYIIFTTILYFILNFKFSIHLINVILISIGIMILGGLIKKWLD